MSNRLTRGNAGIGKLTFTSGASLDGGTASTVTITSPILKLAYDSAAYMTITQADAGSITFDSVSDGTPGFAFSDAVTITSITTAQLTLKYDAAAYMTITQANAGGVTFDSVSDGTAGFAFSDAVTVTSATAAQLTLKFDAAAYMTITQADAAGVTFASVSDGTPSFSFSQKVNVAGDLSVATSRLVVTAATGDIALSNVQDDATGVEMAFTKSRTTGTTLTDNDVISNMTFIGYNDNATPAAKTVAGISVLMTDATDTNEDGAILFKTMVAGAAIAEKMRIANTVDVTAVLNVKYDAAAYMSITQADAGGVTFASVSDGTPSFAFSQKVDIAGDLSVATSRLVVTAATGDIALSNVQDDATGVEMAFTKSRTTGTTLTDNDVIANMTFIGYNDNATPAAKTVAGISVLMTDATDTTEDGAILFKTMVAGAAATEKMRIDAGVDISAVVTIRYDAAAYMTITQADAGGVTFASVSDGTPNFSFSQALNSAGDFTVATDKLAVTATTGDISFKNVQDDATGVELAFTKSRTTGTTLTDNDVIMNMTFIGYNDNATPAAKTVAGISALMTDATDTNEDGALVFSTMIAGAAATEVFRLANVATLTSCPLVFAGTVTSCLDMTGVTATNFATIPAGLVNAANYAGTDVYIEVLINGTAARIAAKYTT